MTSEYSKVISLETNTDEKAQIKKNKREERSMAPRLVAKLKELEQRGLLTKAKAYVCPSDVQKQLVSKD